jgi:hypothetical protein
MLVSFFASIAKYISGLAIAAVVCVIAFPIGMLGYSLNQGLTKHSQIDEAIKKARSDGYSIDYRKVQKFRAEANSDVQVAFTGMFVMLVIYVLIFIFLPKFFLTSLWGLAPLAMGIFGMFYIPDINP